MLNESELRTTLASIVDYIKEELRLAIENDVLEQIYQEYIQVKVNQYSHSPTGIIPKSTTYHEIQKLTWNNAVEYIQNQLKENKKYKLLFECTQPDYVIYYFIMRVIDRLTKGADFNEITKCCINPLINDFLGIKNKYCYDVSLYGLKLESKSIKLDDAITLRQPLKRDYEYEFLKDFSFGQRNHLFPNPSSYLQIQEFLSSTNSNGITAENVLYHDIESSIAIFRLFKVGAVEFVRIQKTTDSFTSMSIGPTTKLKSIHGIEYTIKKSDVTRLKKFWKCLRKKDLHRKLNLGNNQPSYLSIAYDRYCDSIENVIVEKRISSAVMGLEALFLLSNEKSELSYKLRMRSSKLLSLSGQNPMEIINKMKEAYDIRSTFVHGGLLSNNAKLKIERKYGDLHTFTTDILEYLRSSILLMLDEPKKDLLINTIDESFLDNSKVEIINERILSM